MEKERALAQSFNILVSIHKDLDYLGETLAFLRGSPVCIEGCGNCCKQSFHVTGVSAKFIAYNISHLPAERQEEIIRRLEKWLLYEVPGVRLSFSQDGQHELDLRQQEGDEVYRLWCPFLDDESRCLIHLWRDVTCRAWGVTRPIARHCRRRLAATETLEAVQYVGSDNPMVRDIKTKTMELSELLRTTAPAFLLKGWLPYLVYVLLVPSDRLDIIKDRIQEIKSAPVESAMPWILTREDSQSFTKQDALMLERAVKV
jgi:Fe-S-cluster containining protein